MSQNLIFVCSVCKRLKLSDYTWINIHVPNSDRNSHGVCPDCIPEFYPEVAEEVLKTLRERNQKKNAMGEVDRHAWQVAPDSRRSNYNGTKQ